MKNLKTYLLLFLIIILAVWQISLFLFALKWDAVDVVFPFRYHFSESIQSGFFPFWNPYQQTGVPYFADLQAPTYYPELLLVSLFSGYSLYVMNFLFVLYLIIAGTGAYKLSFYFNKYRTGSIIAGLSYALSGFIIGHGQHFFLLVGAAWIPFVILNYLKLNSSGKRTDVLKTSVFLFLMISGSYQALTIILFYILAALFIYFFIKYLKEKVRKNIVMILKQNILLLFLIILFSLPLIFSTLEVMNSVERLDEGVSLESSLKNSLSPKALLSYILPFSSVKNNELFSSDASMRNFYIGIIALIFLIPALLKKRTIPEYILLAFGLILLAASFGEYLPVREFMFKYVPFMNLYKYAPFVNVFTYLAFILIAVNYIAYFQKHPKRESKKVLIFAFALLSVTIALFIYSASKIDVNSLSFLNAYEKFPELIERSTFQEHIFIQASFQILIILLFIFLIIRFKKIKYALRFLIILVVADMFISAQFNSAYTVFDSNHKLSEMSKDFELFPKKFPVPVNDKIIFNDKTHNANMPLWRNTYIFSKQIAFDSFSSFKLDAFKKLHNHPNLKDAVLNNHLLYFSDSIAPLKKLNDIEIDIEQDHDVLFFEDSVYNALMKRSVSVSEIDQIKITEFSPSKFVMKSKTKNDVFLTLLQSQFKGWKTYIDGNETDTYVSNFNYRTIFLPKGEHIVTYEYKNSIIRVLYIISNIFFFVVVLYLLGYWLIKKTESRETAISVVLLISLVMAVSIFYRLSYKNSNEKVYVQTEKKRSKEENLLSLQKNVPIEENGKEFFKIDSAQAYFPLFEINNKEHDFGSLTIRLTGFFYPEYYAKACIVSEIKRDGETIGWHCRKLEKQIENLNHFNRLEYERNFYDLKENDLIKVYIWNLENSEFYLSDMKLDFYKL